MSKLDDIINSYTFWQEQEANKTSLKAEVKALILEIIGDNDEHNKMLADDWDEVRVIIRNNLRQLQRLKAEGL